MTEQKAENHTAAGGIYAVHSLGASVNVIRDYVFLFKGISRTFVIVCLQPWPPSYDLKGRGIPNYAFVTPPPSLPNSELWLPFHPHPLLLNGTALKPQGLSHYQLIHYIIRPISVMLSVGLLHSFEIAGTTPTQH